MLEDLTLTQDELDKLADLLAKSRRVKEREALCIRIGINPSELEFLDHSSEQSFAINLINLLNQRGNTKAICQLCCHELWPIFEGGIYEDYLKEIAVKIECNLPNIIQKSIPFVKGKNKILMSSVIFVIVLTIIPFFGYNFINNYFARKDIEDIENTLKHKQWELADKKTTDKLLKEAGRNDMVKSNKENIKLNEAEIQKISCPVLLKLNKLWESNSQGRFGFRKQNSIWKSVNKNNWDEFAFRVGWKQSLKREDDDWKSISFKVNENEGHLPSFIYVPNGQILWDQFFERVQECGL